MNKFEILKNLYRQIQTAMSAICAAKGLDIDNYSGRFFATDLLEMLVAYGAKSHADMKSLSDELAAKKDLITPSGKPIHEMTLAEFERLIAE